MKNYITKLLFSLLVIFMTGHAAKAQNAPGWNYGTQCLKLTAYAVGVSGPDSCVKIYWQANGTTTTGSQFSYTFPKAGTYQVCMKVINSCRKWDTVICKSIKVDSCKSNPCDAFKPSFTWKADCRKVKFVASTGMNSTTGVTWQWTFGNGATATTGDPSITYVKDGVYKVCLIGTWKIPGTTTVCKKEYCTEIKISCGEPCNIKGDFKFTIGQNGQVKFWASSNTGYTYDWSFGDGSYGTGKDPNHWYKKPGKYNVCVRICDKTKRCCTTICKTIIIEEPCRLQGSFTWKYLGSNTFKFYGYSSNNNGASYQWSFGDGTTGTGKDPQHTYSKPGVYTVCVTIISANKRCKIQICKKVVIEAPKRCDWSKAGFGMGATLKCGVWNLEAYNLSDPCISYQWTINGDPVDSMGGRLKTVTFPENGVYKVCLKLINNCKKCDTVICKEVKIDCYKTGCNWKAKGADFAWYLKCPNLILEGVNLNNGCIKYQYTVGLNGVVLATFNGRVQTIGFNNNGKYTICLKLTDTCNRCDTMICKTVTVECAKPCNWSGMDFTYRIDCRKVFLQAPSVSTPCVKVLWNVDSGAYLTGMSPSYTYSSNGVKRICMKLYDSCKKCDTIICKEIKVDCNPCSWKGASFTYQNTCRKYKFGTAGYTDTCIKYSWTIDGKAKAAMGTGSMSRYMQDSFLATGTYTVCLKMTNTCKNCDTLICQTIKVDCTPCSAVAKFRIDSVSRKGVVYVTNLSTGGYSFMWSWGDTTYSKDKNPGSHAYKYSGSKKICLTAWDSLAKCSTTYCLTYQVVVGRSNGDARTSAAAPQAVQLFPNPGNSLVNVSWDGQVSKLQILQLNGSVVYETAVNGQSRTLDVSSLTEGVYVVRLSGDSGFRTAQLVVSK